MLKIVGGLLMAVLLTVFAAQVAQVNAAPGSNNSKKPITGPITGPDCKPGWGFGDKNHCHSGPPGLNR